MHISETTRDVLIQLFRDGLDLKAKAIITDEFKDISNNDFRIIEIIGKEGSKNMSSIAHEMSVTVGTLTIAINNLVKKGYVHRSRSQHDRRVVLIHLTPKGERAFTHQEHFHREMIAFALNGLDESQTLALEHAMMNLNEFFKTYEKEHRKH